MFEQSKPQHHRLIHLSLKPILALCVALYLGVAPPLFAESMERVNVQTEQDVAHCDNLLSNGDMENEASWRLSGGFLPTYVSDAYAGRASLRFGPDVAAPPAEATRGYSAITQPLAVPAAEHISLSFFYRMESREIASAEQFKTYIDLLDENGLVVKTFSNDLFANQSDRPEAWTYWEANFSLSEPYSGSLLITAEYDGLDDRGSMLVDDVVLCVGGAPLPSLAAAETIDSPVVGVDIGSSVLAAQGDVPVNTIAAEGEKEGTAVATLPSPTPPLTPPIVAAARADRIDFDRLGYGEIDLIGGADIETVPLVFPSTWNLESGVRLQIEMETFGVESNEDMAGQALYNVQTDEASAGFLDVYLNGKGIASVALNENGQRRESIPLPDSLLNRLSGSTRHQLSFALRTSELACSGEEVGTVGVRLLASSTLFVPYEVEPPRLDLTQLPAPLFEGSFLSESATIVVGDRPSPNDLAAVMNVAAGLGGMTRNKLQIDLLTISELDEELLRSGHFILVGLPEEFVSLFGEVPFPETLLSDSAHSRLQVGMENGLIQLAESPWNRSKVILSIGGLTPQGVEKGAQAFSSGLVQPTDRADLAIVRDISFPADLGPVDAVDRTFDDLGYGPVQLEGSGARFAKFSFFVPSGSTTDANAHLKLSFNHSALLDYADSGLTVRVNDQAIGSLRLDDESTQVETVEIPIPRSAIHGGLNQIQIRADLESDAGCLLPEDEENIWLAIWPESALHLPLIQLASTPRSVFALRDYPDPHSRFTYLDETAFVLPREDLSAWRSAVQIAYDLGIHSEIPISQIEVAYADQVSEQLRADNHLIVVGQPVTLPILSELADVMPAAFEPGRNISDGAQVRVQYEITEEMSLGYLEQFAAPWDRGRVILAVLGSDEAGISGAVELLLDAESRGDLESTLAMVNQTQVTTGGAIVSAPNSAVEVGEKSGRLGPALGNEAGGEAGVGVPGSNLGVEAETLSADLLNRESGEIGDGQEGTASRLDFLPIWLLPVFAISLFLIFLITLVVLISTARRIYLKQNAAF